MCSAAQVIEDTAHCLGVGQPWAVLKANEAEWTSAPRITVEQRLRSAGQILGTDVGAKTEYERLECWRPARAWFNVLLTILRSPAYQEAWPQVRGPAEHWLRTQTCCRPASCESGSLAEHDSVRWYSCLTASKI